MDLSPLTLIQIAILSAGIYAVLGFLRTTRGSGLVRGLTVTFVIGMIGLSVLATRLRLEELEYIIEIITGYVVVILVVLFQPELRRGIVQLGENPLVGRLLKARRQEVLTEVAKACVSMARKRQGALIAFERKNSLDSFVDTAVPVDGEVNRFLLDSIFHHGSALHDGGVVLRGERIAAAACLFPLTENVEISRSTGTRHRAALGLTEETDAITVTVSEETGNISICQAGKMQRNVSPSNLEEELRGLLGIDAAIEAARARAEVRRSPLRRFFTQNLGLKASSLLVAVGLYWVAHQELQSERTFTILVSAEERTSGSSRLGQVLVNLPDDSYRLALPSLSQSFVLEVRGPRSRLSDLDARMMGDFEVNEAALTQAGDLLPLSPTDVAWSQEEALEGMTLVWKDEEPRLRVQRFEKKTITLRPDMVPVEAPNLNARLEPSPSEMGFSPTSITIIGPADSLEDLGTEELPLRLEPLRIEGETSRVQRKLALALELVERRFSIEDDALITVTLPIRPVPEVLEVRREISLVSTDPNRPTAPQNWQTPAETALVVVLTRGVLPTDRTTPDYAERARNLRNWIEENVRVVIDVARIPEGSSRGTLELIGPDTLPDEFGVGEGEGEIDFELREPETLVLSPVEPDEAQATRDEREQDS